MMTFASRSFPTLLRLMLVLAAVLGLGQAVSHAQGGLNPNDEYIILSGGPALIKWEKLRREEHQHDKWWGNFIRTARIRVQQLQKASQNQVQITWLVYRRGYAGRADEDGAPLIANIESVRDKFGINLVWYDTKAEVINYINQGKNRNATKISGFEYFGHSNKFCFLLDYGNHTLGASRCFLHQSDLARINKNAFARKAYCKSWGCHSGESFCQAWKRATGKKMIGAVGKTDYSVLQYMKLPVVSPGGRWAM